MALTFTESTLSLLAEEKDGLVASLREQLVSEKAASGLLRAECEAERRKCAVYRDLARSLMEGTAGDTEADAILEGVASAAESGLEASRRLSEAEAAMSGLEAEIASLRAKVGALEKENAYLRAKLEEADSSRPTCADAVTALLGGKLVGRCSSDEVDALIRECEKEARRRDRERKERESKAAYEAKKAEKRNGRLLKEKEEAERRAEELRKDNDALTAENKALRDAIYSSNDERSRAPSGNGAEGMKRSADEEGAPQEAAPSGDVAKGRKKGHWGASSRERKPRSGVYCVYDCGDGETVVWRTATAKGIPEGATRMEKLDRGKDYYMYIPGRTVRIHVLETCYRDDRTGRLYRPEKGDVAKMSVGHFDFLLVSTIMVLQCITGTSLQRTVETVSGYGARLTYSTVCSMVMKVLRRIHDALDSILLDRVKADNYLGIDEVCARVFIRGSDRRAVKMKYCWTMYAHNLRLVYHRYEDGSRSTEVLKSMLEGWEGVFQSDMAAMYKKFLDDTGDGDRVKRLACLAHVRRWLRKALLFEGADSDCARLLDDIHDIYEFERTYRALGLTPEEIRKRRDTEVRPILEAFHARVVRCLNDPDKKDQDMLLKALGYAQAEYDGILRYLDDGTYQCDNNKVENSHRGIALGRHVYYFFGSERSAEYHMTLFALVESAKMHGLDLKDYIANIVYDVCCLNKSGEECLHLLPDSWECFTQPEARESIVAEYYEKMLEKTRKPPS